MIPVLARFGPVTLYSYGLLLAVAFFTASWQAQRAARNWPDSPAPIAPGQIMNACTATLLGGLFGARLLFIFANADVFRLYPLEAFAIWHGGLIWYGGFAGGLAAFTWYLGRHGIPWMRAMDQIIPSVALGHAIGRIGCFLNGCCYGKPTTAWWGVAFPGHIDRVIPTQLIESAGLFLYFLGLRRLQRVAVLQRPGTVFWAYALAYGILRFLVEFARGDQQVFVGELTLPQAISAAFALLALVALIVLRGHASPVPLRRRSR